MPVGIVFCKIIRWNLDASICVKKDSLNIKGDILDFRYLPLGNMDSVGFEDFTDALQDSLMNSKSYPIEKSIHRDGCFCNEDLFVIFEQQDVEYIIKTLSNSLKEMKCESK